MMAPVASLLVLMLSTLSLQPLLASTDKQTGSPAQGGSTIGMVSKLEHALDAAVGPSGPPSSRVNGAGPRNEEVDKNNSSAEGGQKSSSSSVTTTQAVSDALLDHWEGSPMLKLKEKPTTDLASFGLMHLPPPPHLQDCDRQDWLRERLDQRGKDGSRPRWSMMGGAKGLSLFSDVDLAKEDTVNDVSEELLRDQSLKSIMGPFPPWVKGADTENMPLTRQVQRDLWLMQHPRDCNAPGLRFLVADVQGKPKGIFLGLGSQINVAVALLRLAVLKQRVLVIRQFNHFKHPRCEGDTNGTVECYFAAETPRACRQRALKELLKVEEEMARSNKTLTREELEKLPSITDDMLHVGIVDYYLYASPPDWGKPWEYLQPSISVQGELLYKTRRESYMWFLAQGVRYLLRYPSRRLCLLMNRARHSAFGKEAALLVASALGSWDPTTNGTPKMSQDDQDRMSPFWDEVGLFQGSAQLTHMHVRQGDKSKEMKIHNFTDYMQLAQKIRVRFPLASAIWLTTEMERVVEESRSLKEWKFYYTDVKRQPDHQTMGGYEASLPPGEAADNALVNLMIGADCDFFVGTMGSTWSLIVDSLRRTGGKESRGFASVNRDRRWI